MLTIAVHSTIFGPSGSILERAWDRIGRFADNPDPGHKIGRLSVRHDPISECAL
jgi:hypothetical protein